MGRRMSARDGTTAPSAISPDPSDSPDITLTLSNYTVKMKVIDNWTITGAAAPCTTACTYYTVRVRAQAQGSGEHADIQFVLPLG